MLSCTSNCIVCMLCTSSAFCSLKKVKTAWPSTYQLSCTSGAVPNHKQCCSTIIKPVANVKPTANQLPPPSHCRSNPSLECNTAAQSTATKATPGVQQKHTPHSIRHTPAVAAPGHAPVQCTALCHPTAAHIHVVHAVPPRKYSQGKQPCAYAGPAGPSIFGTSKPQQGRP